METQEQSLRAKRLEQVRKIIDKANATPYEEERATFLAAADDLMNKYLIEEWETALARPASEREKPTVRQYSNPEGSFSFRSTMQNIFVTLAGFCRCKVINLYGSGPKVIGFESDMEYLDMLYTSVMLHLSSSIDPRVDPVLPWVVNLAKLKNAGRKWEDIHALLVKAGQRDYPYLHQEWVRGGKGFGLMVSEYQRYCRANNIPMVKISPEVWRRSFIAGYKDALVARVHEMKEERTGAGIELHGRDEAVMEAFYEMFPNQRPHPSDCECETCHFMKCHDPKCTRPRCVDWLRTSNKPVRTRQYKAPAMSGLGVEAGRAKGREISLARGDVGHHKKEID